MATAAQSCLVGLCSTRTPWTRTALLVLLASLLAGIDASFPIQSRTTNNAPLLERRWETLFSRSSLGLSGDRSKFSLLGHKRVHRLYCNVGIGFHLQVLPDGRVSGVHSENPYSLLKITTVDRGVLILRGVRSKLFVAMDGRGRLYGTRAFRDECKFKERLLANDYNAYESLLYPGSYIALNKHGRAKRGNKVSTAMTVTHFLPRV